MFYEQDWLMKQIQMLVRFIGKAVFKKDTDEFTQIIEKSASGADILFKELLCMLAEGEICRAENHLFDSVDVKSKYHLAVALEFYSRLNMLSDDELEKADFSREEIKEGMVNITSLFGLDFTDEYFN
ncbi:MAG: hypothetical protein IKJ27_09940 [Clostridia bacterium]|nr:hypothetical protein [Clostridia bacterium]